MTRLPRRLLGRLVTRLVLTHVLVALVAVVATYLVVRQLAPALFDQSVRLQGAGPGQGPMMGGPGGPTGAGLVREQFGDAVERALLVGALVGGVGAGVLGAAAAYRLTRPLVALRAATRALAAGRYAAPLPRPGTVELAELSEDIGRLGASLAETETRRVRLLGELAHELRTPLTVVDGYVEGMIDGVLEPTPEHLGQVGAEVRRLRRLGDDLSALSRTDEGRIELRLQESDLRSVAASAADRLRPQAEDAELELVVEAGASPLPTLLDPERVAQIVTNLVGNAIRATPPGGRVTVRCEPAGGAVRVVVADTGEGLAEVDLERVFERFYRVPGRNRLRGSRIDSPDEAATPGHADSGSGIGLTIARGIARAHGGEVTAASAGRGRGASFTLELPRAGPGR